jgi:hypothetical protein
VQKSSVCKEISSAREHSGGSTPACPYTTHKPTLMEAHGIVSFASRDSGACDAAFPAIILVIHGGSFAGGSPSHVEDLANDLVRLTGFDVCRLYVMAKTTRGYKEAIASAVACARRGPCVYSDVYVWGVSTGSFFAWWSLSLADVSGVVAHCPVLDPARRLDALCGDDRHCIGRAQLECFGTEEAMAKETEEVLAIGQNDGRGKPRVFFACPWDNSSPVSYMSAVTEHPAVACVWGGSAIPAHEGRNGHELRTRYTSEELAACVAALTA